MNRWPSAKPFRTLTGQLTALVIMAVLVGAILTGGVLYAISAGQKMGMTPELDAASEAARIATIVRQTKALRSIDEQRAYVESIQAPHERIAVADLSQARDSHLGEERSDLRQIRTELLANWHLQSFYPAVAGGDGDAIIVPLDTNRALSFIVTKDEVAQLFVLAQSGLVALIIFVVVICLSIYAVYRVTKPLTAFALAAEAFGRSTQVGEILVATGPLEVARVASALNEMRNRVRRLVDERTRMLAAISHDLRTPLTRLRLRTERIGDDEGRDAMLGDIDTIEAMLTATLSYLRDGQVDETPEFIDLPSFLQTLCDEYVDTGRDVAYVGEARFEFVCRPMSLKRALSNLIDNGLRFGTCVTVSFRPGLSGGAHIEIADDGPGIPIELHDKVFEPYFKVDQARSLDRQSFGLGLAIVRDIVLRDGGVIALCANTPTGLIVSLNLKPGQLPDASQQI